jgi:CheY-like chemotaxis protein
MHKLSSSPGEANAGPLNLARVLVVHSDLAARLTLRTLLQAGGYSVDIAATPSEAVTKMDAARYALVLSDYEFGSRPAGRTVLAYARIKEYRPATALITSDETTTRRRSNSKREPVMSIYTENVPTLLGKVADLIGFRAIRRYRPLRHAV